MGLRIEANLIADTSCALGEGPVWWDSMLWWVDIEGRRILRYDPATAHVDEWKVPGRVGFAVPTVLGDWVIGLNGTLARWKPTTGVGEVRLVASRRAGVRFNDAKCDPRGRLFAGTMGLGMSPGVGTLYRVTESLEATTVVAGVTISNGLAWDVTSRAMYYVDTPTSRIDRFDWDPETGEVGGRRGVYTFPRGRGSPDGMCIDRDGRLWVGLWGGSRVVCVDPVGGEEVAEVPLPCPNVTSCCFGGRGFDELWITTARLGTREGEHPLAGGLFMARPGVVGGAVVPMR